jgi:hypothetical protein
MVDRTYKCNLCKNIFQLPNAQLVGFEFKSEILAENKLAYAPAIKVENHLCSSCLYSAVKLLDAARKNGQ